MAINKEFRVKHGLISEDDVIVNDSVTALIHIQELRWEQWKSSLRT